MKVIFLDFDGVLNSGDNSEVLTNMVIENPELMQMYKPGIMFDERCVRWLEWIIRETGCKIVISSSWRLYYNLQELRQIWKDYNYPGEIIDYTPFDDTVVMDANGDIVRNLERGREIQMWIDANSPKNYCIIDDEYIMLPEQEDFFVQTDPEFGLTADTAKLSIKYLNN